ncbi:hypothetical protein MKX01_032058, partial [Papaver californicum]
MLATKRVLFFSPLHHVTSNFNTMIRAARTESKGVLLGSRASGFQLVELLIVKPRNWTILNLILRYWLCFICNHRPFVIHLKQDIVKLTNYYTKKGLAVLVSLQILLLRIHGM